MRGHAPTTPARVDGVFGAGRGRVVVARGFGRMFRYTQTEVDPVIWAQILLESARFEAAVAIIEILIAIGFAIIFGWTDPVFRGVAIFCLITVIPLLIDSAIRRRASEKLRGIGPPGWK